MDKCPLWLIRLFPFLRWWPMVNRGTLRIDALAGLTGAIVVLPQGVAFATIAGMPPEYGLYAGMIPAIIAALYGSSWHLVSGPTTAASVVLFSSLSLYAEPASVDYVALALTLTFMVGVIEIVLGAVRLGTLVNFISHSVVVGFTAGAAVLIIAKQLKNFFGVEIPRGGNLPEILHHFFQQLGHINPYVTGVALLTLLTGVAIKRWWPRLPYMIVAMLVGSLVALLLNNSIGSDVTGIITIGALPAALPPLSAPDLSLENLQRLAPTALAVTLFALTEAVSIGRSLGMRSGQHIDGNQEFIGQGLSNIAGSFFSGYVATGSFNRSGLNYQAGAKTPLAAVFAGGLLMGIVLLVAPLAAYLPNAAMAGVLFLVAWGLIDFKNISHIFHSSRSESAVLATTLLAALFLELEFSIFLGVLLSLVLYLNRTSRPTVVALTPHGEERRLSCTVSSVAPCPQLAIVRVDGSLFFGAVAHVQESLRKLSDAHPGQNHLLLVAAGINFVDLAGAEMLEREAKRLRAQGGDLYLCNVKPRVQEALQRSGMFELLGADHLFASKREAIAAIVSRLDASRCDSCTAKTFAECGAAPHGQVVALPTGSHG
ncbi:MAG TPA: SulP family inorganic anion transporter [Gammaproteobacteria bacterium]